MGHLWVGLRGSVNPPTVAFQMRVRACIFLEEGLLLSMGSFIHSLIQQMPANTLPALLGGLVLLTDEKRERKTNQQRAFLLGEGEDASILIMFLKN